MSRDRAGTRSGRRLPWVLTSVLTFTILATATLATAARLPCAEEPSLGELVQCVVGHMPRSATGGFQVPDSTALADWRPVVAELLDGGCEEVALPASLADAFEIRSVTSAPAAPTLRDSTAEAPPGRPLGEPRHRESRPNRLRPPTARRPPGHRA